MVKFEQRHDVGAFWLILAVSLTTNVGMLFWLSWLRNGDIGTSYQLLAALYLFASVPIYQALNPFNTGREHSSNIARLTVAWFVTLVVIFLVGLSTKSIETFSRAVLIAWLGLGYISQIVIYLSLSKVLLRHGGRNARFPNKLLVVQTKNQEIDFVLKSFAHKNIDLIRCIVPSLKADNEAANEGQVLAGFIRQHALENESSNIIIALPLHQRKIVEEIFIELLDDRFNVQWALDEYSTWFLSSPISQYGNLNLVALSGSPALNEPGSQALKRALDTGVALLLLIVLAPLISALCVAIKLESKGSILFRQERIGLNGQPFYIYKFRSMRPDHGLEEAQATRNDSRITNLGRFLRRSSMDELPQLINVLKGEMSLIGPRPHMPAHDNYYSSQIRKYMARYKVKPGMTGYAQVHGYRGNTEDIDRMKRRVELDIAYIQKWSLALDLEILIKTPRTLIVHSGE